MTSRTLQHLFETLVGWDPFDSFPHSSPSSSPTTSSSFVNRFLLSDDDDKSIPLSPHAPLSPGSMPQNSFDRELTLLASNFLLYVAMVILLVLVCRIYFPDALRRKGADPAPPNSAADYLPKKGRARPPEYKRVVRPPPPPGAPPGALDSSDDSADEESPQPPSPSPSSLPARLRPPPPAVGRDPGVPVQVEGRALVFRRLAGCSVGLVCTFVLWGIMQERILTRRYPRYTGEYFPYTYFLVFTNRLWSLLFSIFLCKYMKVARTESIVIYEYTFPSISNMLSSWCQYEALKYVSFPAQTLSKSFKIAPVMVMGKILSNKNYPYYDYVTAVVVGVGIAIFMSTAETVSFRGGDHPEASGQLASVPGETLTGGSLLLLFLVFDSFTSQWQDRMFAKHKSLTVPELLFATNAASAALSLITLVRAGEMQPSLRFVYRHSELHWHMFLFSVASTVGQVLIFVTIKNFGAVLFAIVMTLYLDVDIHHADGVQEAFYLSDAVLNTVLEADVERNSLLEEEVALLKLLEDLEGKDAAPALVAPPPPRRPQPQPQPPPSTRLAASLMMGAQGMENLLGRVPLGSGGTLHS